MTVVLFDGQKEKERKKRISHPKVRTGCATCKHKKCDEGRPNCTLCIVSGRKCQYIETLDRRTREARIGDRALQCSRDTLAETGSDLSDRVSLDQSRRPTCFPMRTGQVDLTPDERWYLDFFRRSTSAQCAGYFHDEFWQRLVHQVSDDQPAVCHAVIAMGALNHKFMHLSMDKSTGPLGRTFHLQQCNKAIAHLRKTLMDNWMGGLREETALVTCVVLVSTMLFQEDAQSAARHLRSGYKLLEDYLRHNPQHDSTSLAITQAFAGVHLVLSAFSSPASPTDDGDHSFPCFLQTAFPETVGNIQQAGEFLLKLAPLILHRNPQGFRIGSTILDPEFEPRTILRRLQEWKSQVQGFDKHYMSLSQRDIDALALLEIWSEVLNIIVMVETSPLSRELKYDEYLPQFQKAVYLAKKLLIPDGSQNSLPTFSVNMGIIPPLFFCAFKCRDWLVRQEALLLLRRWRRQEGIWSSYTTALVLKRVIDIESEGLTPEEMVPEKSRIESIGIEISPHDSRLFLRYRRSGDHELTAWVSEQIMYEPAGGLGNLSK